ncbi:MAG: hydrolase [Oscillospiraceae bacterium]|nr:hydrolase [Oscillospiraceae bacterium]
MKKQSMALLAALLLAGLTACGSPVPKESGAPDSTPAGTPEPAAQTETLPPEDTAPPAPSSDAYAQEEAVKTYWSQDQLTQEWGPDQVVEHLFFHPVVCYPELAFDGDNMEKGIDDWMVTVSEYNKILQSVYEKGFIVVDIRDVWSLNEDGTQMVRNTLKLPAGKKPLVISFDDVNYYPYMLENGFTHKLILGDDGNIWSYGLDPQGNEVVSQDLDAITILDKFIREHPDFSLNGAKGCFCLTGYEGILGYRTQTDRDVTDPVQLAAFEENRQREIEAVKPIIARLKETGWYFGSHCWGHINLEAKGLETIKNDTERWLDEVGSLVGETQLLFYPHGARPDGNDVTQSGPELQYLYSKGFRYFFSVGIDSFSKVKTDLPIVVGDRLHPDGTTLRSAKCQQRYSQFYDTREVIDLEARPNYGWYE